MNRSFIFIDDSGDTGFKKDSSSYFLLAAMVVINENEKQALNDSIDNFRRNLGWADLDEFKFNITNKRTILKLIDTVKEFNYKAHIMILDKRKINLNKIPKDKTSLYYRIINELLLKVTLENPVITIDGRAGKSFSKEIRTYLRKILSDNGIHNSRVYLVDSRKNSLVQLADIIVGSVARSYNKEKADNQIYINALKSKIVEIHEVEI